MPAPLSPALTPDRAPSHAPGVPSSQGSARETTSNRWKAPVSRGCGADHGPSKAGLRFTILRVALVIAVAASASPGLALGLSVLTATSSVSPTAANSKASFAAGAASPTSISYAAKAWAAGGGGSGIFQSTLASASWDITLEVTGLTPGQWVDILVSADVSGSAAVSSPLRGQGTAHWSYNVLVDTQTVLDGGSSLTTFFGSASTAISDSGSLLVSTSVGSVLHITGVLTCRGGRAGPGGTGVTNCGREASAAGPGGTPPAFTALAGGLTIAASVPEPGGGWFLALFLLFLLLTTRGDISVIRQGVLSRLASRGPGDRRRPSGSQGRSAGVGRRHRDLARQAR